MVEVKKYHLPPTALVPNSPFPLLHYPGQLSPETTTTTTSTTLTPTTIDAGRVYDLFSDNGWQVQWIFRYGPTQQSHYHSSAHECMAVLSGEATIRFGVADTSSDVDENTHGAGREVGGVEIVAKAGDVFVLPAGTAHKTYDTTPAPFALLTPGGGRGIDAVDPRKAVCDVDLAGFTMLGAYPQASTWDFAVGGECQGRYEQVWAVPKPERDPVLGESPEGLCGLWH